MRNEESRKALLAPPAGPVDVVIDTDAYNEIDDQFAISYLLKSKDKLNTVALYAAPFYNPRSTGPEDGMLKSFDEILKLLRLAGEDGLSSVTFKGSTAYLTDEKTPVISDAAKDLCHRAMTYTPEKPLYVVAIGAITNVASAILLEPAIVDRIVLVWLGGHARHMNDTREFNLYQDVAAARVVMSCGVPFVQLPCFGVVTELTVSGADLEKWLVGKDPLADYLAKNVIDEAESYAAGRPWTRVIWDVSAVAWLLNDQNRFMQYRIVDTMLPSYAGEYEPPIPLPMSYVFFVHRDNIIQDLFSKL